VAVRTTSTDVEAILYYTLGGTQKDANLDVLPYIEIASVLTDKVEECDASRKDELTDGQLEGIERYLAAHLYALDDQQYRAKQTERASAQFGGKTDMGLDFTRFGQMAKILDTSGCLDSFDTKQHYIQMTWLGKAPSAQTDYEDRD
jgi:hypothetical protein